MEPRISIVTLGVEDMARAWGFYHEGLGLPVTAGPDAGIVFLRLSGTLLALYPLAKLAAEFQGEVAAGDRGFSGVTLAHNVRSEAEVDEVLARAAAAGGKLLKPASPTFWGGYSGYFADPDGHVWEVAYGEAWQFNPDGSLVLDP